MNTRENIDLSGAWQIAFDPDDKGLKERWVWEGWPDEATLPVQVPGIWNLGYPDADGVGFYRTVFIVPDLWRGKAVLLRFEGVIYRCDVWVDGKYAGSHEGGYTPFELDITSLVRYGEESRLVVRVAALSKNRAVDGMLLRQAPLSKQSWYYVYGGIWGQVSLEARPMVSCQALVVNPDLLREQAKVEISLCNRDAKYCQANLLIRVINPHGAIVLEQIHGVSVLPGITQFLYDLDIPRPLAWSCDQPHLYHLEVQVMDEDGQTDNQATHFGMRDFTMQNGQFFLNGEPVYIRGVLLQPNFPVNLIHHPNREMMVREITLAKQAGFNLIRLHILPAAPGFLDLADQYGMLIYSESCLAWIRDSPRLTEHGRREIKALIDRDRNHPSIVYWGIYNENPPACAINGEQLACYARSLDPTRVIVDNSGGSLAIDQDFGWIDRATMIPALKPQPERVLDVHLYLGAPISGALYDWINQLGKGTSSRVMVEEKLGSQAVFDEFDRECRSYIGKIFVSELGYGGMSDLDETVAGFAGREDLLDAREMKTLRDSLHEGFRKRKLERVFGSVRNLYLEAQQLQAIGNTQQLEALLTNPRVSGYVITQFNDVSWEFHAGLLDLWRNPKQAYFAAKRLNQPHLLVLRPRKVSAHPGEIIDIDLNVVNRVRLPAAGQLCVTLYDPSDHEVSNHLCDIPSLPGIHPLDRIQVQLEGAGMYRIVAKLLANGETLAETMHTILCLDPVDWSNLTHNFRYIGQAPDHSPLAINDEQPESSTGPIEQTHSLVYLAAKPATLQETEWETLLNSVELGATAIIGALKPDDSTAIQAFIARGIDVRLHFGIGSWMGCYHWVPGSPVFSGLPAGGLALTPYAEILPKYILSELGGEILAGSLRNTQSHLEAPAMLWFSDIECIRFGKGRLLFCQYRAFDAIGHNPVAERLAFNLLQYAAQSAREPAQS